MNTQDVSCERNSKQKNRCSTSPKFALPPSFKLVSAVLLCAISSMSFASPSIATDGHPMAGTAPLIASPSSEAIKSTPSVDSQRIAPEELTEQRIMALDERLKAILDKNVKPLKTIEAKTTRLHELLFTENYYNIKYGLRHTYTAQEALEQRSGNCISLALLFVASARYVGLNAYFQRVDIEQTWERGNGHYIVPGHINARVSHPKKVIVVEFLSTYFLSFVNKKKSKKISDDVVFAEFYNNLAMEAFDNHNLSRADAFLNLSLQKNKKIASTWSNYGVIQKHLGNYDEAEKAYRKAQKLDKRNAGYANNLYVLYRETGRDKEAEALAKRVAKHNRKNPYFLAQLAKTDIKSKQYDRAVAKLLKAIKIKPEEEEFYLELSKSYFYKGDFLGTQKALKQATKAAKLKADKIKYETKLKQLDRYLRQSEFAQRSDV